MPILMYKGVNLSGSGMSASSSLDDASEDKVVTAKVTNELNITKAPLESPVFTGTPEVPTAEKGTNSTQVANTEYVQNEITEIKKSVSDGKTLVANAITGKGIVTAADASFSTIAENISKIETGVELHGAIVPVSTEDPTLIGKTVELEKDGVIIDTRVFDIDGNCVPFIIQESGDYIIKSSDGEGYVTKPITITNDDIVIKNVLPIIFLLFVDGATIEPINNVVIWLKCAYIRDKTYTTIDEVIADTDALFILMSDENAMKYLARSTGFAEEEACANETFMTYLGQSPYVDDTVLNSDLWVSAIKQSPYKSQVLPQAELVVGNTYKFGGYNWIVAEKSDVSGYAVLQSNGVTGGLWPGYTMSKFGNNNFYSSNIDGQDISDYNQKTKDLYAAIKAAEYTSASYGNGLFLVSNSKAGTTSNGSQGSGHYWTALKTAAANYSSFGASGFCAWLGAVNGSNLAWFVNQDGIVNCGYSQNYPFVVAPAFNLDTCLIEVIGDEIVLL